MVRRARRDTYNYRYMRNGRISHRGITNNPKRRQSEHLRAHPGGKLIVEGKAKTRAGALKRERTQRRTCGYYA